MLTTILITCSLIAGTIFTPPADYALQKIELVASPVAGQAVGKASLKRYVEPTSREMMLPVGCVEQARYSLP